MSKYTHPDISFSVMDAEALGIDFESASSDPSPYENFDTGAPLGVGGDEGTGIDVILTRLSALEERDRQREEELVELKAEVEELRAINRRLHDLLFKVAAKKAATPTADRIASIYEMLTQNGNAPLYLAILEFDGCKLTRRERETLAAYLRQDERFKVVKPNEVRPATFGSIPRRYRQGLFVYRSDQAPNWRKIRFY